MNNIFRATLVCKTNNAPYRLYVNKELITERLYARPFDKVISNTLSFEIEECDDYLVKLENMSDTIVGILEWKVVKDEI